MNRLDRDIVNNESVLVCSSVWVVHIAYTHTVVCKHNHEQNKNKNHEKRSQRWLILQWWISTFTTTPQHQHNICLEIDQVRDDVVVIAPEGSDPSTFVIHGATGDPSEYNYWGTPKKWWFSVFTNASNARQEDPLPFVQNNIESPRLATLFTFLIPESTVSRLKVHNYGMNL